MLGDFGQKILQIIVRLQIVRLCRLNEAVDYGAGSSSVDSINENPVLPAYREWAYGPFRSGIIHRDQSIV